MSGRENRGDGRRIPRVEKEIREVVGTYLITGFRGEIEGMITITRVIASKDLRNAKVLYTFVGEGGDKKATTKELMAHVHEFQHEVNRRLQMKHCPRLTFIYDEGYEHAMKVENILRDLSRQRESKGESSSDDE